MINGYLYRKDSYSDNFEEETYLDMFIYQAGKKNKKPIYSLEDIAEARFLVSKAQKNARKKKIDPWLMAYQTVRKRRPIHTTRKYL